MVRSLPSSLSISTPNFCGRSRASSFGKQNVWTSPERLLRPPLRLCILGSHGVGKSAIAVRYLTKRFIGEYKSQVDIIYRRVIFLDGQEKELEIIDISTQPGRKMLPTLELNQSDCFLVVYDVTDDVTFFMAIRILQSLKKLRPFDSTPVTLLGNKVDLEHLRQVSREEACAVAKMLGCSCAEVSVADDSEAIIPIITDLISRAVECSAKTHSSTSCYPSRSKARSTSPEYRPNRRLEPVPPDQQMTTLSTAEECRSKQNAQDICSFRDSEEERCCSKLDSEKQCAAPVTEPWTGLYTGMSIQPDTRQQNLVIGERSCNKCSQGNLLYTLTTINVSGTSHCHALKCSSPSGSTESINHADCHQMSVPCDAAMVPHSCFFLLPPRPPIGRSVSSPEDLKNLKDLDCKAPLVGKKSTENNAASRSPTSEGMWIKKSDCKKSTSKNSSHFSLLIRGRSFIQEKSAQSLLRRNTIGKCKRETSMSPSCTEGQGNDSSCPDQKDESINQQSDWYGNCSPPSSPECLAKDAWLKSTGEATYVNWKPPCIRTVLNCSPFMEEHMGASPGRQRKKAVFGLSWAFSSLRLKRSLPDLTKTTASLCGKFESLKNSMKKKSV